MKIDDINAAAGGRPVKNRSFSMEFESCSENEAFARSVISSFVLILDPTVEEMTEIKTAVSEAVSNCVIHGYRGGSGSIFMSCDASDDGRIRIIVRDEGVGIENVARAREPLFTTNTDGDRSGMGFTVMESFMDRVNVKSEVGVGTEVIMIKKLDVGYDR